MSLLVEHLFVVRHCYIVVAHHISGAPLTVILPIAVFLVVKAPAPEHALLVDDDVEDGGLL